MREREKERTRADWEKPGKVKEGEGFTQNELKIVKERKRKNERVLCLHAFWWSHHYSNKKSQRKEFPL